jgi:hypothetical protein
MWGVEQLLHELQRAKRRADAGLPAAPPGVRSALLEVTPLLGPLIEDGATLVVDLHEHAHDRNNPVHQRRIDAWDDRTRYVLVELLAALRSVEP